MKTRALIGIVLVLAVAAIVAAGALFTIDEAEQAIVVQFGQHVRTVTEPGLHFKLPWVQTVHRYEKRVLLADGIPSEYLTRDRKRVLVDHVTLWRISDPHEFFRRVKTEPTGVNRLNEIVTARLRQEVAQHEFLDLIRVEREAIMDAVTSDVQGRAASLGIEVLGTRIKRADLPTEVQASVFARMEAERGRIASRYRAEGEERAQEIRADADRQKEIIIAQAYERSQILRGEGDAEATATYAAAFEIDAEFYAFWRRLQTYERILGKDTVLILGSDTDLLRYLKSGALPPELAGPLQPQQP